MQDGDSATLQNLLLAVLSTAMSAERRRSMLGIAHICCCTWSPINVHEETVFKWSDNLLRSESLLTKIHYCN